MSELCHIRTLPSLAPQTPLGYMKLGTTKKIVFDMDCFYIIIFITNAWNNMTMFIDQIIHSIILPLFWVQLPVL